MTLRATIEAAMREQAPELHRDLMAAGKLTAHLRDLESEINGQVVDAVMARRMSQGWDTLPPMELARKMKAQAAIEREIGRSMASSRVT